MAFAVPEPMFCSPEKKTYGLTITLVRATKPSSDYLNSLWGEYFADKQIPSIFTNRLGHIVIDSLSETPVPGAFYTDALPCYRYDDCSNHGKLVRVIQLELINETQFKKMNNTNETDFSAVYELLSAIYDNKNIANKTACILNQPVLDKYLEYIPNDEKERIIDIFDGTTDTDLWLFFSFPEYTAEGE